MYVPIADVSTVIVITGTVDTSAIGTYTLTYNVTDAASNAAIPLTRTVVVADTGLPTITLLGDASVSLEVGDEYTDAGATATDAVDGNLSDDIVITGTVDTSAIGTYTLTYNVTDAASNAAIEVTRTVTIEPIPITLLIPDDLVVNARGFLTGVDIDPEGLASAIDGDGNTIDVVANQTGPFRSGSYEIVWTASSGGKTVSATQSLKVLPLVGLSTAINTTEGNNLDIKVLLSGQAADYPVIVDFAAGGTAIEGDDYNVDPRGSVTITKGTMGTISLSIIEDTIVESDETVVITLGSVTNGALGVFSEQVINIIEANLPPKIVLTVSQAGVEGSIVAQDQGSVVIKADVSDPNPGDTYSIDWSKALLALPGATVVVVDDDGSEFSYEVLELDPTNLAVSVYSVSVDVTDGVNTVSASTSMNLLAAAPVLSDEVDTDGDGRSDAEEGAGDSDGDGIPDHEDDSPITNALLSNAGVIQSEPGTTLILGSIALALDTNSVTVTELNITEVLGAAEDQSYDYPMGLVDFVVTGAEFGHVYKVLVPLPMVIPENAEYRKYTSRFGWSEFVENAKNVLSSAMSIEGACPELGTDAYTFGLTAGDNCVELMIEDGGPNDADGVINGTLVDPGGIAVKVIGTPSDNSQVVVQKTRLTADDVDNTVITVTVYDDQGFALEHMNVTGSMLMPGVVVSDFVEQGAGVYTATVTAGMTSGNGPIAIVIDNGDMSIVIRSARLYFDPVPVLANSSGGCTVATNDSADASLVLLLIMAGLLLARRRYQLR